MTKKETSLNLGYVRSITLESVLFQAPISETSRGSVVRKSDPCYYGTLTQTCPEHTRHFNDSEYSICKLGVCHIEEYQTEWINRSDSSGADHKESSTLRHAFRLRRARPPFLRNKIEDFTGYELYR